MAAQHEITIRDLRVADFFAGADLDGGRRFVAETTGEQFNGAQRAVGGDDRAGDRAAAPAATEDHHGWPGRVVAKAPIEQFERCHGTAVELRHRHRLALHTVGEAVR